MKLKFRDLVSEAILLDFHNVNICILSEYYYGEFFPLNGTNNSLNLYHLVFIFLFKYGPKLKK